MDTIIEQIRQWEFLNTLPEELHGFHLERDQIHEEGKLFIFRYHCPDTCRAFYASYDSATKEFMAHTVIGLFNFCDIQYITPDLSAFAQLLQKSIQQTLKALAEFDSSVLGSIFKEKKILDRDWQPLLPAEMYGFRLFIRPEQPVKIVNGSFIIIDYSDFVAESNLTIYYNIYRDEFFSERRVRKLPQIVTDFDAKTVESLAEKLSDRLEPALCELRKLLTECE